MLEAWSFKSQQVWLGQSPEGTATVAGEKAGKQLWDRWNGNRDLKNAWGMKWGDYSLVGEHSWKQCSQSHLSGNKGAGQHHFPSLPFNINTESLAEGIAAE